VDARRGRNTHHPVAACLIPTDWSLSNVAIERTEELRFLPSTQRRMRAVNAKTRSVISTCRVQMIQRATQKNRAVDAALLLLPEETIEPISAPQGRAMCILFAQFFVATAQRQTVHSLKPHGSLTNLFASDTATRRTRIPARRCSTKFSGICYGFIPITYQALSPPL
jgi:hypothetical protein